MADADVETPRGTPNASSFALRPRELLLGSYNDDEIQLVLPWDQGPRIPREEPLINPQRRENRDVIVISSDEDDDDEIQEVAREDIFGAQRQFARNRRIFQDEAAVPRRRLPDDIHNFALPVQPFRILNPPQPLRLPTPPPLQPRPPPRIRLGGGGFIERLEGLPHRARNLELGWQAPDTGWRDLHERSLYLDRVRLQTRIREHRRAEQRDRGDAYTRIFRRAMGMLGWETPEPEDPELEMDGEMPMIAPDVPEAPIHLPDAPKYQVSFTHPNKIQLGFTADFAPVVPETITIEDSDGYSDDDYSGNDEDTKRRKAKGKGKARRPPSPAKTAPVVTLICPVCRDPLRMGGTNENERLYTLRCGHVLDGKCLWRIAKPDDGKGAKSQVEEEKMGVDPRFEFTFAAQPQPSTSNSRDDDDDDDGEFSVGGVYQEVNHPIPVVSSSRLRSGREIVPTPNPGRRRRGGPRLPGRATARGGLDDVDDQPAEDAPPRLDLTDPFLPVLVNPPTFAVRAKGKLRRRKVPKTRGKLQEQIFEWTCPVEGCGHGHISVRLDVSGAPWKPDEEKGAIAMFL